MSDDLALAILGICLSSRGKGWKIGSGCYGEHISNSERVKVVDDRVCETRKEILKAFNRFVNKGFEGVVVKPNAGYNAKWYKLKRTIH